MAPSERFPFSSLPYGWFRVSASLALRLRDVQPLRYFERDLVLWRDPSGRAHLANAFCPHLGAHIGFGGTLAGHHLQCPFHGWLFDADGKRVLPTGQVASPEAHLELYPVEECLGS